MNFLLVRLQALYDRTQTRDLKAQDGVRPGVRQAWAEVPAAATHRAGDRAVRWANPLRGLADWARSLRDRRVTLRSNPASPVASAHRDDNLRTFAYSLQLERSMRRIDDMRGRSARADRLSTTAAGHPEADLERYLATPGLVDALALVTVGPRRLDAGPLRTRTGQTATRQALDLLDRFVTTPGMTPTRAKQLLAFAAMTPDRRVEIAKDLCLPSDARTHIDHRGVVQASGLDVQLIPRTFTAAQRTALESVNGELALAASEEEHRHTLLLQNFGDPRNIRTYTLTNGTTVDLNTALLRDCNRADYMVNGKPMDKDPQRFPDRLRAELPQGPAGDRLATLISDCANQFNVHPIQAQISNATLHPLEKKDQLTHEIWRVSEEQWAVRSTLLSQFTTAGQKAGNSMGMIPMTTGTAALYTVEFRINVDARSQEPQLVEIASDVVFTGGRDTQGQPS